MTKRKSTTPLLAGLAALAMSAATLSLGGVPAGAAPKAPGTGDGTGSGRAATHKPDNRPGPLTERQERLREKAIAHRRNGDKPVKKRGGGATMEMKGKQGTAHYEFPVNRTDQVLTMLSEFGGDGPAHNEIAEPNRNQDNSTFWKPDFDKAHFDELFMGDGESFKNYFKDLSSGRYDVSVTTEDWVQVPGDAATYGANDVEDDGGSWQFITDTVDAWYAAQKEAGKSDAEIDEYLSQFDQWDRYDHDGDGDFNEADGYIDHFQAIHAGEGEEAGGGAQGADAIWSHRWYVATGYGTTGPEGNPLGGAQIGDSGIWVGDYTVEPENGGLGVFAHEYSHDLGLPDYYDTAGGDNGTSFWTLMSSGSWLGHGRAAGEGIGTTPGIMGPEEKYELGWLDFSEVNAGQRGEFRLGPAQHTYDDPGTTKNEADQAVKVNLPDKSTTTDYTTPPEGEHAWWTGRGDDIDHTLTRSVPAAETVTVEAQAWYQIEADYDFLWAEYSTDGGSTWTQVGESVSGSSGDEWTTLSRSYQPEGGAASLFRFRYRTDGGVNEPGAFLDQISITAGDTTVTDGAEDGDNGWTADGFSISTGSDTKITPQYFLVENRQYVGYDTTLGEGPYNFSEAISRPDWVEYFKFRPGMLVWYVDASYDDNNTKTHPGHGLALPVDARPEPMTWEDGTMPTNRRQPFDAAFGLKAVPKTCLHKQVKADNNKGYKTLKACAPASPGKPTFHDSGENAYWDAENPWGSTKLPGSGVTAQVVDQKGKFLHVQVVNP